MLVALPLEQLADIDAFRALGDRLVDLLRADIATGGPGLWLAPHGLFNSYSNQLPSSTETALHGRFPQLELPDFRVVASGHPTSSIT